MRLRIAALVLGGLTAATLLMAQDFKAGAPVRDFQVTQPNGATANFDQLKGNVTLVMFISVQCPVSNAYNERMQALYEDYSPKGVKFIVMNANRGESAEAVMEHATQHKFGFTVYKDNGNVAADLFGATVTPEAYVIDSSNVIRYHGSIDDSQNPTRVTTQRLRAALDAVLAGKEPPQTETKAFGCSIKRVTGTR